MKYKILRIIKGHERKKIQMLDLYSSLPSDASYESVAEVILDLVAVEVLKPVKSSGVNGRKPALYNTYAIEKSKLNTDYYKRLQKMRLIYDSKINLDEYYQTSENVFEKDLPYLNKINEYLNNNGLPTSEVTIQERSYDLVGDEKWLHENNGLKVLNRIGLLQEMKLITVEDPAMFAINPNFMDFKVYKHLIVENKAVYLKLLPLLNKTTFSTLIYGAGWRIVSSMNGFKKQFPFEENNHHFYYFGDVDHEGFKIGYALKDKWEITFATPFYEALLNVKQSYGKTNQKKDLKSLEFFMSFFNDENQSKFVEVLNQGGYYPQEALDLKALEKAWRKCNEL